MQNVIQAFVSCLLERNDFEWFFDDENLGCIAGSVGANRTFFIERNHLTNFAILKITFQSDERIPESFGCGLTGAEQMKRHPFRGLGANAGEFRKLLDGLLDLWWEERHEWRIDCEAQFVT